MQDIAPPQDEPQILFFSGGTALNGIARAMKARSRRSVHLITPFDSGGSSQVLRKAFSMPAVGDLRSRLMALADEAAPAQAGLYRLFTTRLPRDATPEALMEQMQALYAGTHPLLTALPADAHARLAVDFGRFAAHAPADLDFRGASLGNLVLTGSYLGHGRRLAPALRDMSQLAAVQGEVRAIADVNLQIGVRLRDGQDVIGQRQMTGKECPPLSQPITELFLSDGQRRLCPETVPLPAENRSLILGSDLICFAPGSFYSSLLANLLPAGTGRAVAASPAPKVYLPSLGTDPEARDMGLCDRVEALLAALRRDTRDHDAAVPNDRLLNLIICDTSVAPETCAEVERRHGLRCLRLPLHQQDLPGKYDSPRVVDLLLELCGAQSPAS